MTTNQLNRFDGDDLHRSDDHDRTKPLPPGVEPLLSINDLATVLSCSRRLVERMCAGGKVPKPDLKVGRMPRWRADTIRRWIEDGGKP
jgi:predicted DNA-binding transcriptional regulator AlpA